MHLHYKVSRFVGYNFVNARCSINYNSKTIQIGEVFQSPELVRDSSYNIYRINLPVKTSKMSSLSLRFLPLLVILIGTMHRTLGVHKKNEERDVQSCDATYCGVDEITVTFDYRVVGRVFDGDSAVDGGAGAKLAAVVPLTRRLNLPCREDGVQSPRCRLITN